MERFLFKWNPIALRQFFWRDEASLQSAPQASPVEFYDAQNIGQLQWPADSYSLFIKQLFCPLIENGTDYYFHNLKTTVKLLKFQELVLPIMINDHDYDNSYICSPYSFYISYAFESLAIFKNQQLKKVIMGALHVLSKIFHQNKFNKVIHVNNLPFSSTIYPPLDRSALKAIIDGLTNKFPEHAIIFRAFNYHLNGSECQSLKNLGASLIAYRQGYLLDTGDPHALIGKTLKKDFKCLQKTDYEVIDTDQLREEDLSVLVNMYKDINITRHSKLNLDINEEFIRLLIKNNVLHFKALRKNGCIDGFFAYFCQQSLMISPLVGYNKSLPKEANLYRCLSTLLILEAQQRQVVLHLGAGASHFKQNRKAKGYLEYLAVYHRHLPFKRRLSWILLKGGIHLIGIHYMKKY